MVDKIVQIIYGIAFILPALFCTYQLSKLLLRNIKSTESKKIFVAKKVLSIIGILYFLLIIYLFSIVFIFGVPVFHEISNLIKAILFIVFLTYWGTVGAVAYGLGYLSSWGFSPTKTVQEITDQIKKKK